MRKIVQKQIIDMIPAIWDGVQYIQTAEPENALTVLQDCLLAMKTLRESLRSGLSETRFAYYQHFYDQAFLSLGNIEKGLKVVDQISEIYTGLDTILTDITEEKEVKLEILFLPYKASMWDSLESIWLAAKDDAKCDAYVMPIPYCDRNPDGSPAAWHCEADLFPEYVPVTDFNQYDIAKRKPDVIYIHNPYDEYNRVTSVDPKYYSSELKKHTDMLVYVPYFVVGDFLGEHFCQTPGVVNADRVIVESEEIKNKYEKYYPGGNPPKHKFLALGSPKFDKVLNSKREDFILPQKWIEIIKGKKTILYNTSLAAMLENPDAANAKLRYVLDIFKNRKDVSLWWRPHPLIKATMQSMHPTILQEYNKIEQNYVAAGWGIYDDSPDLHRAITWSDGYYGDRSSVVSLYKVTKKPVMIQNMAVTKPSRLRFSNIISDHDKMWFVSDTEPYIFSFNKRTNRIQYEASMPLHNIGNSYLSFVKINNKIILAPYIGNDFLEYDIHIKKFNIVPFDFPTNRYSKYEFLKVLKFDNVIYYKSYVFFISTGYPVIVKYDTITGAYSCLTKWFEKIKMHIDDEKECLLHGGCARAGKLLLTFCQKNIILEIDIETEKTKIYFINDSDNKGYQDIIFDGADYWLIPRHGKSLVKWNYQSNNTILFDKYPDGFNIIDQNVPFVAMMFIENKILLFPFNSNAILSVDFVSGEISKFLDINTPPVFSAVKLSTQEVWLSYVNSDEIKFTEINRSEIVDHFGVLSELTVNKNVKFEWGGINSFNGVIFERPIKIEQYIKFITMCGIDFGAMKGTAEKGRAGEYIYTLGR